MNIKLTDEQRLKMTAVFAALNAVKSDRDLMKQMKVAQTTDMDDKKITAENEEDFSSLANFCEDIRDTAQEFDFYN